MSVNAKLAWAAAVIVAVTGYVAYLGASSGYRYYLMVDECVDQADIWKGKRLRVNGRVKPGSLTVPADRCGATFALEGTGRSLAVSYRGVLPDNLTEGREVVVEGSLNADGRLAGENVITKCASKYAAAAPRQDVAERPAR